MHIPDKYRDRYDNLARSHPWMREMRDGDNMPEGELIRELRHYADDLRYDYDAIDDTFEPDERLSELCGEVADMLERRADAPEGDAVKLMREYCIKDILDALGIDRRDRHHTRKMVRALADMVERDYVSRETHIKAADIWQATCDEWEKRCRKLEAERDEKVSLLETAFKRCKELEAERDEWKRKADEHMFERDNLSDMLNRENITYYKSKDAFYVTTGSLNDLIRDRMELQAKVDELAAKSAKRASAVERLRKCYPSGYFNVLRDAFGWEHGSSHSDKEWRDALIDLLTDDNELRSNDGETPENGVSADDVDANDGNANLGSEPVNLGSPHGNGSEVDSREKLKMELDNIISAALRNLRRAIYQCVEQRMDVLSFSDGEFIDFEHEEFVGEYVERAMKVLDRQAAITRLECAEGHRTRLSELHGLLDKAASERELLRAELTEYKHSHPDAPNQPIGQFNAPKSEETAGIHAAKGDIRDFDADSREKLEAELHNILHCAQITIVAKAKNEPFDWHTVDGYIPMICELFDRQAAITERELCKQCEWPSLAAQPDREAYDRIAELRKQVDSLTVRAVGAEQEADELKAIVDRLKTENAELRGECADCAVKRANRVLSESVDRLTRERDALAVDLADAMAPHDVQMRVKLDDGAPLPRHAKPGDAGLDLTSRKTVNVRPGETQIVGTGVRAEIPEGHFGLIAPRSGLASKHGITLANTPSVIDSGYRGEIMLALHNIGNAAYTVHCDERVAQMVVVPFAVRECVEVDELSVTERGEGGFGSSGSLTLVDGDGEVVS